MRTQLLGQGAQLVERQEGTEGGPGDVASVAALEQKAAKALKAAVVVLGLLVRRRAPPRPRGPFARPVCDAHRRGRFARRDVQCRVARPIREADFREADWRGRLVRPIFARPIGEADLRSRMFARV